MAMHNKNSIANSISSNKKHNTESPTSLEEYNYASSYRTNTNYLKEVTQYQR